MRKDLNKYKTKFKQSQKILNEIKTRNKETDWINYIFPQIHGLNIIKEENNYKFNNILEARDFLNDKSLNKEFLDICRTLLKLDDLDFLNETEKNKIKASLTLFDYITKSNIKGLLTFRNYEKKQINKFTYKKQYEIFKKIIDKFFSGKFDEATICLIESEIYFYSRKEEILENISKKEISNSEDILIKYSEISPLVLDVGLKNTTTIKEFYKSLTKEEYALFCKFKINKKKTYKLTNKTKESIILCLLLIVVSINFLSLFNSKENTAVIIPQVDTITNKLTNASQNQETKEEKEDEETEIKETNEEQSQENENLELITQTEETKTNFEQETQIINYPYIEPTGYGNEDIVNIALTQVGNVGGEIYWSWYGFSSHVAWCGCFVSWVVNQAGISENIIPKFARAVEGAYWFINRQLFRDRNYTPRTGDLIFFDYDYNGKADHVGIVKNVSDGKVYTIEGNVKNDQCKELSYRIGNDTILGYGTPNY